MSDTRDADADGRPSHISEAEYRRFKLVEPYFDELKQMAHAAMYEWDMRTDDFVLLCIEACTQWKELLRMLGPDTDPENDIDEERVILSVATIEARDYVIAKMPGCTQTLMLPVPADKARLIVINAAGCAIYNIKPTRAVLQ